jgi:hypothetical protein
MKTMSDLCKSLKVERLECRNVLAAVPWVAQEVMDASELMSPGETHAADLDGDQDLDIVVAGSTGLAWWQNDGQGRFSPIRLLHADNWNVSQLKSGDLDGDRLPDLVARLSLRTSQSQIVWFRNLGNGQFASIETIQNQEAGAHFGNVIVADLDGDQRSEVLSVSQAFPAAPVVTRISLEANQFRRQTLSQISSWPVAAADMDADGDNDLLVNSSEYVAWVENTDGDWTNPVEHLIVEVGPSVDRTSLADMDRDGDPDVAILANDRVSVYRNSMGTFDLTAIIDQNKPYVSLTLADADGDGDIDIQTRAQWENRLLWYLNEGNGSRFSSGRDDPFNGQSILETADLTGDGQKELIRRGGIWSVVKAGLTTDDFSVPIDSGIVSLAVGDMNGDGHDDLVTIADRVVQLQVSIAGGILAEARRLTPQANFGGTYISDNLQLVDLDGDGDLDVLTTRSVAGQSALVWLPNDGTGNLEPERTIRPGVGAAIESLPFFSGRAAQLADFDRDGDTDIVLGLIDSSEVQLLENVDGRGRFQSRTLSENLGRIRSITVAEIDGDGDLDVVVGAELYGLPFWLENLGRNTVVRREPLPGIGSGGLQAVDLNRDGISEVGGATFSDVPPFANYQSPRLPGRFQAVGDIDRDGDLDLVLNPGQFSRSSVGRWWDHEQGFTGTERELPVDLRVAKLIDIDRDGDLDIAGLTNNQGLQFIRNELVILDGTGDGIIDDHDLDVLCAAIGSNRRDLDFTNDGRIDSADHRYLVQTVLGTTRGDANLDGVFDSGDLVAIFQQGKYETNDAAGWASGDWNCDGRFSSEDLVAAFEDGGYERSPRAATGNLTDLAFATPTRQFRDGKGQDKLR